MCKHNICSAGAAAAWRSPAGGSTQFAGPRATLPGGFAAALAAVQEGSGVHVPPASRLSTAASEPKVKIPWLCRDVSRDWQAEASGLGPGKSPACPYGLGGAGQSELVADRCLAAFPRVCHENLDDAFLFLWSFLPGNALNKAFEDFFIFVLCSANGSESNP